MTRNDFSVSTLQNTNSCLQSPFHASTLLFSCMAFDVQRLFADTLGTFRLHGLPSNVACLVGPAYCLLHGERVLPMSTKLSRQWWSKLVDSVWWLSSVLLSDQVGFPNVMFLSLRPLASITIALLPFRSLLCQRWSAIQNDNCLTTDNAHGMLCYTFRYMTIHGLDSLTSNWMLPVVLCVQEFLNKHAWNWFMVLWDCAINYFC